MALEVLKNSYVTLEEAKDYFENRLASDLWLESPEDKQAKALITATQRIDNNDFIGYKKSLSQPLEFPRNFTRLGFGNYLLPEIPKEVKIAVFEEAITLLQLLEIKGEEQFNTSVQSMKTAKLGDVSITFAENQMIENATNTDSIYSTKAQNLLNKWTRKGYSFSTPKYEEIN